MSEMEFEAVFFSREVLWLTPGDLGRFQLQRRWLRDGAGRAEPFQPTVLTIGALEKSLLAELPWPEMEDLSYRFLLYDLAGPLLEQLGSPPAGPAEELRMRVALAQDLGDGLGRLKLAGLTWDQVAALPPSGLARILAEQGRCHDAFLDSRGRLDKSARRRRLLERLKAGQPFKTLAGVRRIIYRQVRRLSPFETEFLLALAGRVMVEAILEVPPWVRDEKIGSGAGFDLLRSIRRLEQSAAPGLELEFAESAAGSAPPALAYAADVLLSPEAGRLREPPDPAGQIQIVRTPTAYHEVEEAARRLKKLVHAGLDPEDLALVVPSLTDYGPLVEDLGRRFGLAFHFRRGRPLAELGPARAILNLAEVWGSHWERARVLDLVHSPYFHWTGLDGPVNTDGLTLAAGVTDQRAGGGFEGNLAKFIRLTPDGKRGRAARALLDFVNRLKQAGRDLASAREWPDFFKTFKSLLAELGWPGPAAADMDLAAAEKAVAKAMGEELIRLESALARPPAPPVGLDQFRLWLKTILYERRAPDSRVPDGRIWVLNYYDLHGGLFEEIFFLGLNERVFPQTGPDNMWWPREFVSAAAGLDFLGRSLWSDAADRYRQEELLLAAGLGQARKRVWLFHHTEDQAGKPVLPSPLLTALKDLWPANGERSLAEEVTVWRSAPDPAEAAGPDEIWVILARLEPADWPAAIPRNPANLGRWAALRRRWETWRGLGEARPGPDAVARWLKARHCHQGAPLLKPSFMAAFADCPLAFWYKEALKLTSDGAPLEEWPPVSEGDSLHRIMEAFFRPRLGPDGAPGPPWPGAAEEGACLAELLELAEAEAERASREPLGRLPLWRLRQENLPAVLTGWLKRELAADRPEDEARPWLLEWSFGPRPEDAAPPWALGVQDSETIYFHGRADRIDRTGRGLWVRDYKRRDSAGLKMKPGQPPPTRSWPLLIYALAAGAHFDLAADCSFEIMDAAEGEARRTGPTEEDAFDFPGLLVETWSRIKAGIFRPEDGSHCAYCLFDRLCPKVDGEAAREPA